MKILSDYHIALRNKRRDLNLLSQFSYCNISIHSYHPSLLTVHFQDVDRLYSICTLLSAIVWKTPLHFSDSVHISYSFVQIILISEVLAYSHGKKSLYLSVPVTLFHTAYQFLSVTVYFSNPMLPLIVGYHTVNATSFTCTLLKSL